MKLVQQIQQQRDIVLSILFKNYEIIGQQHHRRTGI